MRRIVIFFGLFIVIFSRMPMLLLSAEHLHKYDSDCDPDCNLCFEERVPPHLPDYSSVWLQGAEYHYKKCVNCGELAFTAPHTGGEYTFDETGHESSCTVCGRAVCSSEHELVITKADGEGHVWGCCECGYESAIAEHRYESECSDTCRDCSDVREAPHANTSVISNGDGHSVICLACGAVLSQSGHEGCEYLVCSLGHYRECALCPESEGFFLHNLTDGACECGYVLPTVPETEDSGEHGIMPWVLLGVLIGLCGAVAYINRRRIYLIIESVKEKINKNN